MPYMNGFELCEEILVSVFAAATGSRFTAGMILGGYPVS